MEWYVYDDDGTVREAKLPEEGHAFFADMDKRRLAYDEVGDATVSTVFLSLDHGFGEGPPVLWETMIFGGKHDGEQWRYTSREDALAGHATALALVQPWPIKLATLLGLRKRITHGSAT